MKILKPGKVEQRKFVCPACECEFEAGGSDKSYSLGYYVLCPCCNNKLWWIDGEPVEGNRERLMALLKETPDVMVWPDALAKLTQHLIANGVTFREV